MYDSIEMLYNWQIEFTNTLFTSTFIIFTFRPVGAGGAGGFMSSPDFGRSVNPILTEGADYAHQIILTPPDFKTFLRPCNEYLTQNVFVVLIEVKAMKFHCKINLCPNQFRKLSTGPVIVMQAKEFWETRYIRIPYGRMTS